MTIKEVMEKIDIEKIMQVIALNEISGDEKMICKFSFAGGISGYSFGRSQFDVTHNQAARIFLEKNCNFRKIDIDRLLKMDKFIADLNFRLGKYRKEIDELDKKHIEEMIKHVASLEKLPEVKDEKTFVHLVDYHNQFNMSKNGKFYLWLKEKTFITPEDVLVFKLKHTKWGTEHPEDVKRRWNNIERFYSKTL